MWTNVLCGPFWIIIRVCTQQHAKRQPHKKHRTSNTKSKKCRAPKARCRDRTWTFQRSWDQNSKFRCFDTFDCGGQLFEGSKRVIYAFIRFANVEEKNAGHYRGVFKRLGRKTCCVWRWRFPALLSIQPHGCDKVIYTINLIGACNSLEVIRSHGPLLGWQHSYDEWCSSFLAAPDHC